MLRNRKRFISLLLVLVLIGSVSGCGTEKRNKIPKLKEPIASTRVYRPAKKEMIHNKLSMYATAYVVPENHYQFYTFDGTIEHVYVKEGDLVKKGDLLASLDVSEMQEQIALLNQQIEFEQTQFEKQQAIQKIELRQVYKSKKGEGDVNYQLESNQLPTTEQSTQPTVTTESPKKTEKKKAKEERKYQNRVSKEISNMKENHHFANQQHEAIIADLKSQIADLQSQVASGNLYADHGGIVTYAKSIEKIPDDSLTTSGDCIAMISDINSLYLQVPDVSVNDTSYQKEKNVFVKIGDDLIPLEEYSYSSKELSYMQSIGQYAQVRYQIPKNINMQMAESYVLYFTQEKQEDMLAIGLDSLHEEGQEYYCYIKTKHGEEKRKITVGERDSNYVQVLSGIEEGDLVAYNNTTIQPSVNKVVKISAMDQTTNLTSDNVNWQDSKSLYYTAEQAGTIKKVYVKKNDKVRKGDPIFSYRQIGEKSSILSLEYAIKERKDSFDQEMKEQKKQMNSLTKEFGRLKKEKANIRDITQKKYEIMLLEAQNELKQVTYMNEIKEDELQLEILKKKNAGSDENVIRATEDGVIESIQIQTDDRIKKEQSIYQLKISQQPVLCARLNQNNNHNKYDVTPRLGQNVIIKTAKGESAGRCIYNDLIPDVMIATKDEHVYQCKMNLAPPEECEFAVDDKFDATSNAPTGISFSGVNKKQVIVIPVTLINVETDIQTGQTHNYVWKLEDNVPVKEYIIFEGDLKKESEIVVDSGVKDGDQLCGKY